MDSKASPGNVVFECVMMTELDKVQKKIAYRVNVNPKPSYKSKIVQ